MFNNDIVPVEMLVHIADPKGLVDHVKYWAKKNLGKDVKDITADEALDLRMGFESIVDQEYDSVEDIIYPEYWNYDFDDWKDVAPYLSGYIEWENEAAHTMWRDVFTSGQPIRTIEPRVVWPDEAFYVETWCDEDLINALDEFGFTRELYSDFDEVLDQIRKDVSVVFDDKSPRNEIIRDVVSSTLCDRNKKQVDPS